MTAILPYSPGKMHHRILFDRRLDLKGLCHDSFVHFSSMTSNFLDNAWTKIQNMVFKTSKMDQIALEYWYYGFLGRLRVDGRGFLHQQPILKKRSPERKSRCRTCAEACHGPFNLSLVSSVTQAITVTEKQNTAIKISVKSLVRPFNIVRFEVRWDIQKPSSAEYFELSWDIDWQGNKCFALFSLMHRLITVKPLSRPLFL